MIATGVKRAFDFILSPGSSHDAPLGRLLMETVGRQKNVKPIIMDTMATRPAPQVRRGIEHTKITKLAI